MTCSSRHRCRTWRSRRRTPARTVDSRPALVARERPARVPALRWRSNGCGSSTSSTPASAAYNLPIALRLSGASRRGSPASGARRCPGTARGAAHRLPRHPRTDPHQVIMPAVSRAGRPDPLDVDAQSARPPRWRSSVAAGFDVTADTTAARRTVPGGARPSTSSSSWFITSPPTAGRMTPLAADVMVAYAARVAGHAPAWAPLPVQYADYTLWQRALLGSEDDPDSAGRAADRLLDSRRSPVLPGSARAAHRPAASRRDVASGRHVSNSRSRPTSTGVSSMLAQSTGATLFMVMHAALAVLLPASAPERTSPSAPRSPDAARRRSTTWSACSSTPWCCAPTVEPGDTFAELLDRVRDADLAAFAHADVPFERLVEVLNPDRSAGAPPAVPGDARVPEPRADHPRTAGPRRSRRPTSTSHVAKFDLQLTARPNGSMTTGTPGGLAAGFDYATDLFDESTVASFGRAVRPGPARRSRHPARPRSATSTCSTPANATALLGTWNDTGAPTCLPMRPWPTLFDAQVAARPRTRSRWCSADDDADVRRIRSRARTVWRAI